MHIRDNLYPLESFNIDIPNDSISMHHYNLNFDNNKFLLRHPV